ncbi:hypothetical protein T484DRAFT_1748338 [Baffinella frigidus]|nr:hypothetical protein T484DRAFT_1748338 [Cryptophyta sp. CCMP2293]
MQKVHWGSEDDGVAGGRSAGRRLGVLVASVALLCAVGRLSVMGQKGGGMGVELASEAAPLDAVARAKQAARSGRSSALLDAQGNVQDASAMAPSQEDRELMKSYPDLHGLDALKNDGVAKYDSLLSNGPLSPPRRAALNAVSTGGVVGKAAGGGALPNLSGGWVPPTVHILRSANEIIQERLAAAGLTIKKQGGGRGGAKGRAKGTVQAAARTPAHHPAAKVPPLPQSFEVR